jgi:hypothetical protein
VIGAGDTASPTDEMSSRRISGQREIMVPRAATQPSQAQQKSVFAVFFTWRPEGASIAFTRRQRNHPSGRSQITGQSASQAKRRFTGS